VNGWEVDILTPLPPLAAMPRATPATAICAGAMSPRLAATITNNLKNRFLISLPP